MKGDDSSRPLSWRQELHVRFNTALTRVKLQGKPISSLLPLLGALSLGLFLHHELMLITLAAAAHIALALESVWHVGGRSEEALDEALGKRGTDAGVCVFLGDSLTHGSVSADWVEMVARLLHPITEPAADETLPSADETPSTRMALVKECANGEVTSNKLRRARVVGELLAAHGEDGEGGRVVLLIGTNDVLSANSRVGFETYRRAQGLSKVPTAKEYEEMLQETVRILRCTAPRARLALATLPPIGETLDDPINARRRDFNGAIRRVAAATDATLLELSGALEAELARCPLRTPRVPWDLQVYGKLNLNHSATRLLRGSGLPPVAWLAKRWLRAQTWDALGESAGPWLTHDLIHLNERSGAVLSELVRDFLVG